MSKEQKKISNRMDAIYDRQGEILENMKRLMGESIKLRKENEKLLKRMGWW
jgi:regulator of replication initiation timing